MPLPTIMDTRDGAELSEEASRVVHANHEINIKLIKEYRDASVKNWEGVYEVARTNVLKVEAELQFYMELYSHCDGAMRDLIKERLLTLFRPNLRGAVAGNNLPQDKRGGDGSGLLGGEAAVKARLTDATKTDDLINKVEFFSALFLTIFSTIFVGLDEAEIKDQQTTQEGRTGTVQFWWTVVFRR